MTDELDRIRELRGEPPAPSAEWVDRTRSELLAMAAEEEHTAAQAADAPPASAGAGPLDRLRRRLADLFGAPPPLAWAGATAVVVAVVAAVAVLGQDPAPTPPVAQDTDETSPASPAPEDDEAVLASSCTGGDGTYTVRYPEDWHSNDGEVTDGCQYFDREPVELEEQTGGAPSEPIVVQVVPVAFDRASEPGPADEELSREETTVAGRDAVRATWESTGEAALPEGVRSYRYVVDLGDRSLLLVAHDLESGSFDEHRRILDAMAEELQLED